VANEPFQICLLHPVQSPDDVGIDFQLCEQLIEMSFVLAELWFHKRQNRG
jgi:hypothetical protein